MLEKETFTFANHIDRKGLRTKLLGNLSNSAIPLTEDTLIEVTTGFKLHEIVLRDQRYVLTCLKNLTTHNLIDRLDLEITPSNDQPYIQTYYRTHHSPLNDRLRSAHLSGNGLKVSNF